MLGREYYVSPSWSSPTLPLTLSFLSVFSPKMFFCFVHLRLNQAQLWWDGEKGKKSGPSENSRTSHAHGPLHLEKRKETAIGKAHNAKEWPSRSKDSLATDANLDWCQPKLLSLSLSDEFSELTSFPSSYGKEGGAFRESWRGNVSLSLSVEARKSPNSEKRLYVPTSVLQSYQGTQNHGSCKDEEFSQKDLGHCPQHKYLPVNVMSRSCSKSSL